MKICTICKNREFSRVYAKGKAYVHPQVVLYVMPTKKRPLRVGYTATKKVGGAVQRNRARRVMKAAMQGQLPQDLVGYDLILVARGQTTKIKSTVLSKTLDKLFVKAGLKIKEV